MGVLKERFIERSGAARRFSQWRHGSSSARRNVAAAVVLLSAYLLVVTYTGIRGRPKCTLQVEEYETMQESPFVDESEGVGLVVNILTQDRAASLGRLLWSLHSATYPRQTKLVIWIDRLSNGRIESKVLQTATNFVWPHGPLAVHVWKRPVGICGQWLNSWQPVTEDDFGIILEDDLEVSPQFAQWLHAAREAYGHRRDIFGYTLQRATLRANNTGFGRRKLDIPEREGAYLYPLVGSWGYAPEPAAWCQFRDWYRSHACDHTFWPGVDGLLPTKWYDKQKGHKAMWTIWHIRYAFDTGLKTVYANLRKKKTLAANWREPGLHFGKPVNEKKASAVAGIKDFEILNAEDGGEGKGNFRFPSDVRILAWNGTYLDRNGVRTAT